VTAASGDLAIERENVGFYSRWPTGILLNLIAGAVF
jgi:hypothetical protein